MKKRLVSQNTQLPTVNLGVLTMQSCVSSYAPDPDEQPLRSIESFDQLIDVRTV